MPGWLLEIVKDVVRAIVTDVLASHGVTPKPPAPPAL